MCVVVDDDDTDADDDDDLVYVEDCVRVRVIIFVVIGPDFGGSTHR